MNKIFKVIWNPATGSYTVASETAKSRGKKSGRSKLLISALVVGGLLSSGVQASTALDGGGASESTPLTDTWIAIGQGAKASSVGIFQYAGQFTSVFSQYLHFLSDVDIILLQNFKGLSDPSRPYFQDRKSVV